MIYLVQDAGTLAIKIGYAANPTDRLSALQTGNASLLVLLLEIAGDRKVEADLHRQFASARLAGEWFRATPDLIGFIADQSHGQGLNENRCDCYWDNFQIVDGVIVETKDGGCTVYEPVSRS